MWYLYVGWHLPEQHHVWQSGEEAPCPRGCSSSYFSLLISWFDSLVHTGSDSPLSWFSLDLLVQQLPASQNFTRWLCNNNPQHKLKKTDLLLHPTAERIYNSDPHHWVFHLTQHNRDNDDRSADLEEDCLSVLPTPTLVKSNRHLAPCFNTNALPLAHTHHRRAAIFS